MKKTILLMCLSFGMIVSACKKDDPVTPAVQTGTVTISFKTNTGMTINKNMVQTYSSLLKNVDTTIVFNNVTNNTRFDVFLLYSVHSEASLKIMYNNNVLLDSLVMDTTSTNGTIDVLYVVNDTLIVAN